jgi:hypothetical protein
MSYLILQQRIKYIRRKSNYTSSLIPFLFYRLQTAGFKIRNPSYYPIITPSMKSGINNAYITKKENAHTFKFLKTQTIAVIH